MAALLKDIEIFNFAMKVNSRLTFFDSCNFFGGYGPQKPSSLYHRSAIRPNMCIKLIWDWWYCKQGTYSGLHRYFGPTYQFIGWRIASVLNNHDYAWYARILRLRGFKHSTIGEHCVVNRDISPQLSSITENHYSNSHTQCDDLEKSGDTCGNSDNIATRPFLVRLGLVWGFCTFGFSVAILGVFLWAGEGCILGGIILVAFGVLMDTYGLLILYGFIQWFDWLL